MKVILYHANWCGHCTRFQPEWEKLNKMEELKDVELVSYEYSKNKNEIDKANITGFPTIHVEVNGKVEEYSGQRNADAIKEYLKDIKGYLKYKRKYLRKKMYNQ